MKYEYLNSTLEKYWCNHLDGINKLGLYNYHDMMPDWTVLIIPT